MPVENSSTNCALCGHPAAHAMTDRPGSGGAPICEGCDRCWAEQVNRDRPPHHS